MFLPPLIQRFKNHLAGKDVNTWTEEERHGISEAFQTAYLALEAWIGEAEKVGEVVFIKEHINWLIDPIAETRFLHGKEHSIEEDIFTIRPTSTSSHSPPSRTKLKDKDNETCLPDSVLNRFIPTILIRNPLLTIPSQLRTSIDNEGLEAALSTPLEQWRWETSFHWSRSLYTYYSSLPISSRKASVQGTEYPIILDADDLPKQGLMKRYAQSVGLNDEVLRFEWDVASQEDVEKMGKTERRMRDTLLASRGIVGGKTAHGLSVEGERDKWRNEFGDELAERVELLVKEGMGDYEWLWERRFR